MENPNATFHQTVASSFRHETYDSPTNPPHYAFILYILYKQCMYKKDAEM
jgi:hypothetical protein